MALNPSVPGRIPTKYTAPNAASGTRPLTAKLNQIGKADQKSGGKTTQYLAAHDGQKRLNKSLGRYKDGEIPTKPKNRISWVGIALVLGSAAIMDIIGLICTFLIELAGIPEIIMDIVDLSYGILLTIYARVLKKLEFGSHWKLYGSLLGGFFAEEIPFVSVAPFWILDALLLVYTLRVEDKETYVQTVEELQRRRAERYMEQVQAAQIAELNKETE